MANDPNSRLEKALARRADSGSSKPHWRELMARYDTVPSSKSTQAPEVIAGFFGSWAAQFGVEGGDKTQGRSLTVPPIQTRSSRLGLPGMAEINFRPYDVGTLRKSVRGPSLLGHPISFEVVGPTSRSVDCHWQWRVDTSGAQDRLWFDTISATSTAAAVVAVPAGLTSLDPVYGLTTVPAEGLYLVISLTGTQGRLSDGAGGLVLGGVGDGQIGEDAAPPGGNARTPISPLGPDGKYEIFRIVAFDETDVANDTLVLDSGKRLADYFNIPNPAAFTPIVRAVMIVKPAATRMVAMPGARETLGSEQTFAFVPPAQALNSDFMPPRVRWDTDGLFDPITGYANTGTNFVGLQADYDQKAILPIEIPTAKGTCRLQGINGEAVAALPTGRMRVILHPLAPFDVGAAGQVLNLRSSERFLNGEIASVASEGGAPYIGEPLVEQLLGYWEIVDAGVSQGEKGENYYDLRMVTQFDPLTGVPFYGHANLLKMATGSLAGEEVWFDFAIHPPVSSLWMGTHLSAPLLNKSRLANLIDPKWVEHTTKGRSNLTAGHFGNPDKAIFSTASSNGGVDGSNANPGSLMDLGFRVVFFPAIALQDGSLVPDFDHPVEGNEVILDPTKTDEPQFIEVDYSSGLVHFSHAPVPGPGCQIAPNADILLASQNPRGEMVFFASCVPFSREPGQMGVGSRVTAGQSQENAGNFCGTGTINHTDIYGERAFWPLTNGQTINSTVAQEIQLSVALTPLDLPASGFVDIVLGPNTPGGAPPLLNQGRRACTYGYTGILYVDAGNGGNTTLIGVFGGSTAATSLSPTVTSPMTAVLRRNILTPNDPEGVAGTDFQYDTTYGCATRATALRFRQANMVREPDGSVTVDVTDPRTDAHEALFDDLFSSWVITGGIMTSGGLGGGLGPAFGNVLDFTELIVIIGGVRSILPAQQVPVSVALGPPKDIYVYIDGSDPTCPIYAQTDTLPLPGDLDVLIGEYDHDGVDVGAYADLTHPLLDVDKRLDVTVGQPLGHAQPASAHFSTLADAVEFVSRVCDPTDGEFGQFRRIKVIGPTIEQASKLPIAFGTRTSGLIIEGMMPRADGSLAALTEITWSGVESTLFDLSDCDGWTIRNLRFRYDQAVLPASVVALDRNLFQVGSIARNILIENVSLAGPCHAFLYCDGGGGGGGGTGIEGLTLRNCSAVQLTDHAIRVETTAASTKNILITECAFTARKSVDVPGPALGQTNYGILNFASLNTSKVVVENSILQGGDIGVMAGGVGPYRLTSVHITDTDQVAILVGAPDTTIEHCWLEDVHTLPASGATAHTVKCGIFHAVNNKQSWVVHNTIALVGAAIADDSIFIPATTKACHVSDNTVDWNIVGGDEGFIRHNIVALGRITCGDLNVVEGNHTFDNAGDLSVGSECHVSDNYIAGDLLAGTALASHFTNNWYEGDGPHVVGDACSFTGDTFGDPSPVNPNGRVQLGDGNRFTGCLLVNGIQDGGAGIVGNQFINCDIRWNSTDVVVGANGMAFLGCHFTQDTLDLLWEVDGINTVFCGNTAISGGTFYFHDTPDSTRQGYVVADNNILSETGAPFRGGFLIEGNYCTITGNNVEGYESHSVVTDIYGIMFTGRKSTISDNSLAQGLYYSGAYGSVTGNHVETDIEIASGALGALGDNTVSGNSVRGSVIFASLNSTYSDNHVDLDATLSGLGCSFTDSVVQRACIFSGNNCLISGNVLGTSVAVGSVVLTGDDLSFNDNRVLSPLTMGVAGGTKQNLVGNHIQEAVTIAAANFIEECSLSGNTFLGTVNLSNTGTDSIWNGTITGNVFLGAFTCRYSIRTTFSGNRFAIGPVDLQSSAQAVVQGNILSATSGLGNNDLDVTDSDNYVILGNLLTGDILLDNGAPEVDTGVVVGNKARSIAAGVTPTNGVVAVGNKVNNGQAVFGTSPATTSAVANNVSD